MPTAAEEALKKYEEFMKRLNEQQKNMANQPEGYGAQTWVDAVNSLHKLNRARNEAINAEYDPQMDKIDKKIAKLKEERNEVDQALQKAQDEYDSVVKTHPSMDVYESARKKYDDSFAEYKAKVDGINKQHVALRAERNEVLEKRKAALDAEWESYKKNMAALNQNPLNPTKLQPETSVPKVAVKSDRTKEILADYNNKFKDDPWYKDKPAQQKDGKLNLQFKSNEDAINFLKDQAKDNKNFTIVDPATKKVMGYSQDGKFYHATGKEVQQGDKLTPGDKTLEEFKKPTASAVKTPAQEPSLQPLTAMDTATLTGDEDQVAQALEGAEHSHLQPLQPTGPKPKGVDEADDKTDDKESPHI